MSTKIVVTVEIPRAWVYSALETALTQGSGYWCAWDKTEPAGPWDVEQDARAVVAGEAALWLRERDDGTRRLVGRAEVKRGIALALAQGRPINPMDPRSDARTADHFLQLCAFGTIRYA